MTALFFSKLAKVTLQFLLRVKSLHHSLQSGSLHGRSGCGGGIQEGTPKNVDMSKDYTPKAAVGNMNPGDFKKVQAKAKEAANAAKSDTPESK